jgi:hypothetical protein
MAARKWVAMSDQKTRQTPAVCKQHQPKDGDDLATGRPQQARPNACCRATSMYVMMGRWLLVLLRVVVVSAVVLIVNDVIVDTDGTHRMYR